MQVEDLLQKDLKKRLDDNSLRTLKPKSTLIDFSSNDYLGLARDKRLYEKIAERHRKTPINGATGSRLLSGNDQYYEQVEEKLADYFSAESSLIFNSGYTANLAILSTIPKKGDTIIYDELSHACIKDGSRLSLANRFSFKHNDLHDLEQKLKKCKGIPFIVVESIYSMDGDESPLLELVALAKRYEGQIILDEAHATGIYGPQGSGLSGRFGLEKDIFARIYTFGKAMGIHGAAVAGRKALKDYMINFARPFIYTTALPYHSILSIDMAFEYLHNNMHLQEHALKKVEHFNHSFNKNLKSHFHKIESDHPIQSIIIPGNNEVKTVTEKLTSSGFDVRPILSPTVKKGEERLRICLHSYNEDNEISALIDTLAALK